MHTPKNKGSLEVICGPMFSGKSEELIRRIRRAKIARQKVMTFKHRLDDRISWRDPDVVEIERIQELRYVEQILAVAAEVWNCAFIDLKDAGDRRFHAAPVLSYAALRLRNHAFTSPHGFLRSLPRIQVLKSSIRIGVQSMKTSRAL